ncbi:MAG: hypothetical protein IT302_07615 [Dehalococcoidia bacterium]|nr:hypothetical protein [Dehalococcoidia bacterium]
MKRLSIGVAGLAALTALAVACGGDNEAPAPSGAGDASGASLAVNLKNWAIEPSSATVKAGTVTFRATHKEDGHGGHGAGEAGATHQLVVARLEEGAEVGQTKFEPPVLNLANIKLGEEKTGKAMLEPGRYELSCLVVDGDKVNHYKEGMYALLTVE